jgi:phospholipid/cholesterol/gamma-HCH transport system substrate-binding protein
MIQKNAVEIAVGVFIVMGLAALVMLAMKVSNIATLTNQKGYHITARFENIGGLKERAAVTMAGVRVGRVQHIAFDEKAYEAVVTMVIEPQYNRIPIDTTASILTSGLLGEQYLSLEAGGEEAYFKDGDQIKITQSAMIMEKMIGQFLFNKAAGGGKAEEGSAQ